MDETKRRALTRRKFLKVMGAAGLAAGCSPPAGPRKRVPYLDPPEDIIPGMPLFYRTVCRECPSGCGVTARTREGRVVKLEGNPDDPIGRGALCARGQAAVQDVYAPARLRAPMKHAANGQPSAVSWDDAIAEVAAAIGKAPPDRMRLLTRSEPGAAGALQREFLAALRVPPDRRVVLEPFDLAPLRAAGDVLFGRPELPTYDLAGARTVVSFGADFLETWLSPVELARSFAQGRGRVGPERTRLVWIGPRLCLTGVSSDEWLPARSGSELWVALGLLRWLCDPSNGVRGLPVESGPLFARLSSFDLEEASRRSGIEPALLSRLGAELDRRRPSAVLGPGVASTSSRGTELAVAIQLINAVLGNVGRTVLYGLDPREDPPSPLSSVRALVEDMAAGRVDVLLLHHADPVGALPPRSGAAAAISRVPLVVSFSGSADATTRLAHLVLPDHHPLESFGDVTPRRGIVALAQPVMTPLWETRSASQTLLDLWGKLPAPIAQPPAGDFRSYVQSRLAKLLPGLTGDPLAAAQRAAQQRGGLYSEVAPAAVELRIPPPELFAAEPPPPAGEGALYLVPYAAVLRQGDVALETSWLREIPDPLTTLSWTDWIELAPATARRFGVAEGDLLAVTTPAGVAELPACVFPGLREDTLGIPLGGPAALELLPLAFDERSGGFAWISSRATVRKVGRRVTLPRLRAKPYQEGREIVRVVTAAAPGIPRPPEATPMYTPPRFRARRWAMAIDLDRCTGCQACVVACYAENNVPVVGATAMTEGRSMAWLRLEHFYAGEGGKLRVNLLLMLCQHCTSAPCEPVCPVYATYHNPEGLNTQVYNRCVGTRYCSNNCPYKVRVFNWSDPTFPAPLGLQLNPDVTVRSKGVMEKCTFCAQRIRAAELEAETAGRALADGEVVTACAQTCPTGAIVFGDANDPGSRVSRLAREARGYHVLEDVNTGSAITYLARIRQDET